MQLTDSRYFTEDRSVFFLIWIAKDLYSIPISL